MRNIHLLVIGLCSVLMQIHHSLYAQEKKKKSYSLDVHLISDEHRKGILKAIEGTNILIQEKDSDSVLSIPVSDIHLVKVKKVNVGGHILKGTGIIIGAASGFVLGFINGYNSDPDCDDGSCLDVGPGIRGIGQGLIGGVIGGALGSLLSNPTKKYVIDGLPENFEKMKLHVSH